MSFIQKVAVVAALSAAGVKAAMLAAPAETGNIGVLFSNIGTTPNAKTSSGLNAVAAESNLKWEIMNLGYIDEDTGDTFMEITTMLTTDISQTDVVTFHIEYTSSTDNLRSKMCRDGFETTMSKSATTGYWDVTVTDLYARSTDGTDCSTATDIVTSNDYNNAVENDG